MTNVMTGEFDCRPETRAMVERQVRAWITGDIGPAAADWHRDGILVAPGARVAAADIPAAIADFHRLYHELVITVTVVFESPGGWICLEWLWEVTRRVDGARSMTADAIVVEMRDGLILGWREYFDTAHSVEAHHVG